MSKRSMRVLRPHFESDQFREIREKHEDKRVDKGAPSFVTNVLPIRSNVHISRAAKGTLRQFVN